jgi:hypothetical protein
MPPIPGAKARDLFIPPDAANTKEWASLLWTEGKASWARPTPSESRKLDAALRLLDREQPNAGATEKRRLREAARKTGVCDLGRLRWLINDELNHRCRAKRIGELFGENLRRFGADTIVGEKGLSLQHETMLTLLHLPIPKMEAALRAADNSDLTRDCFLGKMDGWGYVSALPPKELAFGGALTRAHAPEVPCREEKQGAPFRD